MAEIALTRGMVATVDDVDLPLVADRRWHVTPSNSSYGGHYAISNTGGKTIYMHRLILGAGDGQMVDHADHDGLNNSRSNIRLCTISQNNMNRRTYGASGFKNVFRNGSYIDGTPRWRVFLDTPESGRIEGGSFRCQDKAIDRADELARVHYGEFALLNRLAA